MSGGRFVAVGRTDEIRSLVAAGTEIIDAEGMTVTPGFIDTHCHPSGVRELYGVNVNDYDIGGTGASDYMPGPFEPLMAIQSIVTRKDFDGRVWGANQRATVDEALRIGTLHGAYASFEEDAKGSIRAGKLADFVLLAGDPHETDPDQIKAIEVVRTVVGGRTVHPGVSA